VTPPFSFTAEAHFRDGTAEVIVSGDVDLTATEAFAEALARALSKEPRQLMLNLGAVKFLDCAAARVIAEAARVLPPGQFTIRDPSLPAYRLLQLTGLGALVEAGTGGMRILTERRRCGVR
jgi:anti-anti-sigma factor